VRRRGLLQFTPETFEVWNWAAFQSPKRFLQALLLVVLVMMFELNAFFLKTLLWIPPPHKLNIARLVVLGFLALPAVKEYHTFINVRFRPCALCVLLHRSMMCSP
jgi:phosphatidylserine synthase 2